MLHCGNCRLNCGDGMLAMCRWNSAATAAPGPGSYDHNVLSMQTELEKKTSNTARHGAFGVGERFVKPRPPDSASVSS